MATKDKDWVRHGRSQRSITVGGRHFFAQRRCGRAESGVWTVQESDQAQVSGSRAISPWSKPMAANRLSAYVDAVVDFGVWEAGQQYSTVSPEASWAENAWMAARGFEEPNPT